MMVQVKLTRARHVFSFRSCTPRSAARPLLYQWTIAELPDPKCKHLIMQKSRQKSSYSWMKPAPCTVLLPPWPHGIHLKFPNSGRTAGFSIRAAHSHHGSDPAPCEAASQRWWMGNSPKSWQEADFMFMWKGLHWLWLPKKPNLPNLQKFSTLINSLDPASSSWVHQLWCQKQHPTDLCRGSTHRCQTPSAAPTAAPDTQTRLDAGSGKICSYFHLTPLSWEFTVNWEWHWLDAGRALLVSLLGFRAMFRSALVPLYHVSLQKTQVTK